MFCRALEYVDIAAQTEPTSVFNAFLRLKVYLLQKDRRAAANQVQAMMKCEDFTHEILRVSPQAPDACVFSAKLLVLKLQHSCK